MTETELIKKAKKGDQNCFGQLYDLYAQKLFAFIRAKTHHQHTSEDLLQEVFIKAWRALPNFDESKGSFSSWMYKIATNCMNDHFRSLQRRPYNLPLEDHANFIADNKPTHAEKFDVNLESKQVQQAMEELPDDYRQVLILRFKEGLPAKEVGAAMNKSSVAVRLIQHRALKKLQIIITNSYETLLP